jgi:hypothetical protein
MIKMWWIMQNKATDELLKTLYISKLKFLFITIWLTFDWAELAQNGAIHKYSYTDSL